ncbi:Sec7-domain-containing protein [Dacryopinax primogenitus]|uniref:Sec7-domain-containing protein n=1 Tax=Dacryopinax primogenitus (strain DJM 731) TaxID=1858805 RepID=M5FP93_DACPD|nr:Sec7-domain-containing protein [Dacryopinax primogenitus]EJT98345.1 Sec7-domain-containing protein [Dacryopinax primogenitus]
MVSSAVQISAEHVLQSEITSVISAMRKNSRWAAYARAQRFERDHRSGRGYRIPHEVALFTAFGKLRKEVKDADDVMEMPLPQILAPFLAVLNASSCPSTITLATMTSLHNILKSPLMGPSTASLPQALTTLSTALAKLRFEPSDTTTDELLMLKQLDLIYEVFSNDIGSKLGNPEACELLECVLSMCYRTKFTEMLRRAAEYTMHRLIRLVFVKLASMDPEVEEQELEREEAEFKLASGVAAPAVTVGGEAMSLSGSGSMDDIAMVANTDTPLEKVDAASAGLEEPSTNGSEEVPEVKPRASTPTGATPNTPYSLITHQSLIVALISLLSPHPPSPPNRTLVTLSLFHTLLLSSPHISAFPALLTPLLDNGCRNLFWLVRSDHPGVQTLALKAVSALLEIFHGSQTGAYQRELFLTHCLDRLQPPPPQQGQANLTQSPDQNSRSSSPAPAAQVRPPGWLAKGDTRLLLLSALAQLANSPSYFVEVFVNCDCDAGSEDMFEKLITFLCTEITRGEVEGSEGREMCTDILLGYVAGLNGRSEGEAQPWPDTYTAPSDLLEAQSRKRQLRAGSTLFNQKPKLGLAFFEENGFIYTDPSEPKPLSLAKFLKTCQRLDKRVLGEYLGALGNEEILQAFLGLFAYEGKVISEALRDILETFRLPGEAQPISRVTEAFAKEYRAKGKTEIKSDDAAFVLAYSVIMLNTDLHNPQNSKKRMTLEEYGRNLRGVNEGENFTPEFISNIYDSIKKQEIIMPEEHIGQVGFDYAWRELMIRSKNRGPLMTTNSKAFDDHLFSASWKPVVGAVVHAFITVEDDNLVQRLIASLRHLTSLAAKFDKPKVFDYIVSLLADATGLIKTENTREGEEPKSNGGNYPLVQVDDVKVTVSPLSIQFGKNFKGQLAAVVIFSLLSSHVDLLRENWVQIFEILKSLFLASSLPRALLEMEDFLSGDTVIPLKGSSPPAEEEHRSNEGGLLSTLSAYLLTPYGASSETVASQPTQEDVENTMSAVDTLDTCNMEKVYAAIMKLSDDPLLAVLRAIRTTADRTTIDKLNTKTPSRQSQLPYDPTSLFFLEIMVSIVLKTRQQISETWEIVFEYISVILSHSDKFSILLVERTVVALLKLCNVVAEEPKLHDQLYVAFDLLGALTPVVKVAVGEQLMIGLDKVIREHRSVIRSQTEWRVVLSLLRPLVIHADAARIAFDTVESIVTNEQDDVVTIDNYGVLLVTLQDFTNAAGQAVAGRQQHLRRLSAAEGAALDAAVPRGTRAIELMFDMKKFVPQLVHHGPGDEPVPESEVWETLWLPLLTALQNQALNTSRDVRHTAIGHLQRLLLLPQMSDTLPDTATLFEKAVFPLTKELLKPQVYLRDPHGMSETRMRAAGLLCKTFLHYSIKLHEEGHSIDKLWVDVLDYLDKFMNSGKHDQLYEAVPESLKNVVLVLHASNVLVPPWEQQNAHAQQLWVTTQQRMDRFLPSFLEELIPPPPPVPQPVHHTPDHGHGPAPA